MQKQHAGHGEKPAFDWYHWRCFAARLIQDVKNFEMIELRANCQKIISILLYYIYYRYIRNHKELLIYNINPVLQVLKIDANSGTLCRSSKFIFKG